MLQSTFTPYKLHLIEQTAKMKNSDTLLNNFLHTDETNKDLSEMIQKKVVMKKYREIQSACSLYALIDQNTEYFRPTVD